MTGWGGVRTLFVAAIAFASATLVVCRSADAVDIELGRYLAAECMACHRAATATSTVPNIFGMAEQSLTAALKAYRSKQLPNPVMQNIASRLTDEEIASLGLYFSSVKQP